MSIFGWLNDQVLRMQWLRKDRPDLGEADISASLTQFDKMWKALIPAEQARVVRLLVARV